MKPGELDCLLHCEMHDACRFANIHVHIRATTHTFPACMHSCSSGLHAYIRRHKHTNIHTFTRGKTLCMDILHVFAGRPNSTSTYTRRNCNRNKATQQGMYK